MKILLIYALLITFFVDEVIAGQLGFSHIIKGFSLMNFFIYLLLFVWMTSVIQRRKFLLTNNLNLYLVLMGYVVLVSIFVMTIRNEIPNLSLSHEIINFKTWLKPVILFFILFNIIDDEKTCNRILIGLFFLFITLIITQLFASYGIISYKEEIMSRHGRIGGFGAAGEYAITLALFFPIVISESFYMDKRGVFKIICIFLGLLILVGLIHAGSRNGVVSFLTCILVYIFFLNRKKIIGWRSIFFLFTAIIIVGSIGFAVSPPSIKVVSQRYDPTTYENVSDFTSGRIELWKNGWKLFVDSPIIGHGLNSFKKLSSLRGYKYSGAPHNEYIKYLSEQGLIGLIVFLLIFYKIFISIWRSLGKTTDPRRTQLYTSYIAGLSAYCVGIFATNAGPSLFFFWIYTAIIYKYAHLDMENIT